MTHKLSEIRNKFRNDKPKSIRRESIPKKEQSKIERLKTMSKKMKRRFPF